MSEAKDNCDSKVWVELLVALVSSVCGWLGHMGYKRFFTSHKQEQTFKLEASTIKRKDGTVETKIEILDNSELDSQSESTSIIGKGNNNSVIDSPTSPTECSHLLSSYSNNQSTLNSTTQAMNMVQGILNSSSVGTSCIPIIGQDSAPNASLSHS